MLQKLEKLKWIQLPIGAKSEGEEKEARKLKARNVKFCVIKKQIINKTKELKEEVLKREYADPSIMKELEVREDILESKEWIKRKDEARKILDSYEQEAAMLGQDVDKEVDFFDEVEMLVKEKISDLKSEDKKKGYYAVTGTKPKENVVFPKPFEGLLGVNVYKWCREMKDAMESAQVREEDRVKKIRQYLSGDAKIKV